MALATAVDGTQPLHVQVCAKVSPWVKEDAFLSDCFEVSWFDVLVCVCVCVRIGV